MMYPFCRSLAGNQIEELPAGVFSNNNKLLNLWVGRLKVHSRPTYFYCKILLFWVYLFYLHMGDFLYGRCSRGLRGIRLCSLKLPCALLVFKHVMSSYVIVWRSFINNSRFFRPKHDKKVVWSFIFCIAKPALLISKEWLFYINYCMIVSKQIMMSIIA